MIEIVVRITENRSGYLREVGFAAWRGNDCIYSEIQRVDWEEERSSGYYVAVKEALFWADRTIRTDEPVVVYVQEKRVVDKISGASFNPNDLPSLPLFPGADVVDDVLGRHPSWRVEYKPLGEIEVKLAKIRRVSRPRTPVSDKTPVSFGPPRISTPRISRNCSVDELFSAGIVRKASDPKKDQNEAAAPSGPSPDASAARNIVLYFDGACEPINPRGIASYGYILEIDGAVVHKESGLAAEPGSDRATNNVAEYVAMIRGMEEVLKHCKIGDKLVIRGDSQLVLCQTSPVPVPPQRSVWRVRSRNAIPLNAMARKLVDAIKRRGTDIKFEWIPRRMNSEADRLSKMILTDEIRRNPQKLLNTEMPWGKFEKIRISELPDWYYRWIWNRIPEEMIKKDAF